jgi:acetyltransferase-like isoleucine patch superfamily enzyme
MADPLQLMPRALTKLYSVWVSLFYPFASKGRKLSIHFTAQLHRERSTRISLGNDVIIQRNAWINLATDDSAGNPLIVIEDNCCISTDAIISARNRIHIERDVMVGQSVLIQDHNHAYEDINVPIRCQGTTEGGTIRIGAGTFIGKGAAIICSKGNLNIGRHCVIATHAVVHKSIPDYSVVFGVPARITRQFDPEKGMWVLGSATRPAQSGVNDLIVA